MNRNALFSHEFLKETDFTEASKVLEKRWREQIPQQAANLARLWSLDVRYEVPAHAGRGYSELYKVSENLTISTTNSRYFKDTWIGLGAKRCIKIRIMLSGKLHDRSGTVIAKSPDTTLSVHNGDDFSGYKVFGDDSIRMVTLTYKLAVLTEVLGLDPSIVPDRLGIWLSDAGAKMWQSVGSLMAVKQAARLIVDSRLNIKPGLLGAYRHHLGMQILMHVFSELSDLGTSKVPQKFVRTSDADTIYEVRDFLKQNFAKPPTIPDLARRFGISETKLKSVFRQTTGCSIYKYILQCRMEVAADLLQTRELTVSDVGYAVGYSYPANFTQAFKKYHGSPPRCTIVRTEST